MRVSWTARRSNQSILKETNPKYSLERMMLKLKLQYFAYLLQREDTLGEKNPDAGKDLRQEDRGEHEMFGWHHRLNGPEYEQTLRDGEG